MISIFFWTVSLYLAYCGILFLLQRQMLFPRDLIQPLSYDKINIPGLERIWVNTEFEKVETWFIPPEPGRFPGPAPLVIFAHGNAELIDFWPDEFRNLTKEGFALLLVEYPGYGRSGGSPSQESITRTFIAAYDMISARPDINPDRIILMGRSLGGGAVCQLAAKRSSCAMILMSTFTSARSFTKRYAVPGFLMRDPFDNLKVIQSYPAPVLVIHGQKDELIPCSHAEVLAEKAAYGSLIIYESAHNDCPPDWSIFWKHVKNFLNNSGIIQKKENPSLNDRSSAPPAP